MNRSVRQRGFTLIELMVATVVALFATLAIFQSFAVSEGYRRNSTGGGDAAFSGAVGVYLIDHDLRMAGYGVNKSTYFGCAVSGVDLLSATPRNIGPFTLAPVQITPGINAQTPDSITVVASSSGMMPGAMTITSAMSAPTDNYTVTTAFGVNAGDVLLLAQAGSACTITQATNTPARAATNQNVIQHATGSYTSGGTTARARYNPAGGEGPAYAANAVVMDLGPSPLVSTYYVQNDTLTVDQVVSGQLQQAIAPNIVQLKAFYGKDTNGDGIVDTWNTVAPVTSTDWANVLAIRLAVVARSSQPQKPDPNLGCITTTALPSVTWDDGTVTTLDVSTTGAANGYGWQCYRYKVFHVTSSLLNLIWTPS